MEQQERLHALDAVRAFALLLGVFFHAAMSFINVEVESLHWAISDSSQSYALMALVGISHIFRMSLFFFIAGFFAHLMYHRKGAAAFARNRVVRIAVPFVAGWCVIAPCLRVIWHWGQTKSGIVAPLTLWPTVDEWQTGQINLTHLWFLYYLGLIYILFVGSRHLLIDRLDPQETLRRRIDGHLQRLMERGIAPLAFSLPIALVAAISPSWNPASGMPTPDRSFIPEVVPLVGYGTVFAMGWIFHRRPEVLQLLSGRIKSSLWLMLPAFVAMAGFGTVLGVMPTLVPTFFRFVTAIAATSLMWFINFALIGYALKRFAVPSRATRYVADASYWIYLAHLPVVCALQVWVAQWPLHWSIKYPIVVGVAFVVLFASYHLFVRYTFIGAVLNGRKSRTVIGNRNASVPVG